MAEEREREPSYAWVVVGVMFFAQAVALGVRGTIGLLIQPWEAEFGGVSREYRTDIPRVAGASRVELPVARGRGRK